jgi:hypothetical protein
LPTAAVLSNLQKAAAAQNKLDTVGFKVEVKAGKAEVRGSDLQQAEGVIKKSGDFQASVKVGSLFGPLTVEVLSAGNEQFTTNPITGGWIRSNQNSYINLDDLLDPKIGVSNLLLNLKDPKFVGAETLDGVKTFHYQGTATGKQIAPISIYTLGKHDAVLDIWIGTTDDLVRQINLKEIDGDGVWTITFSRFNEAVSIKKPQT